MNNCLNCNKETKNQLCCSSECALIYYRKKRSQNVIKNTCHQCGKLTTNLKFCSHSCNITYQNINKKRKQYYCKKCGELISNGYQRNINLTKCTKCTQKKLIDKTLKELKQQYSINNYHSVIRAHARRTYELNNKSNECGICQYNKHVDICHIKSVKDFDCKTKISVVNNIKNLIALCPNHHWEFDNGLLKL